jgi:hypothetical protein
VTWVAYGLVGGLVLVLVDWLDAGLDAKLKAALVCGLVLGLAAGFIVALATDDPDLAAIGPITLFSRDRRNFLVFGLAIGLMGGLVFGLVFWLVFGIAAGLKFGLGFGLVGGTAYGLMAGLSKTAWGHFDVVRAYLSLRRSIPWNLMAFLQDAHKHRGVLRQVGPVYQFRHIDLQHHLGRAQAQAANPHP